MNKNKDFQVGGPEKNMDVGQEVQMLDIKKRPVNFVVVRNQ